MIYNLLHMNSQICFQHRAAAGLLLLALLLPACATVEPPQATGTPQVVVTAEPGDGYPPPTDMPPSPTPYPPPGQAAYTPWPTVTPALPAIARGASAHTQSGNTFELLFVGLNYSQSGELCEMYLSPDGQKAALFMCHTEGKAQVLIVDLASGNYFDAVIIGVSGYSGDPFAKRTWFRGWFPDSKRVLLMSDWLEILNVETGERQMVTSGSFDETVSDAAVSPDGQRIVYTALQLSGALKLVGADGLQIGESPPPSPKPGVRPRGLTWSPSGSLVAFVWDQIVGQFNNYGPLWVLDPQTMEQRPLSPEGVYDSSPIWSPQGDQILVVRRENMDNDAANFDLGRLVSNLWVVNVTSGEWRQLTDLQGAGAWAPAWTPDGSGVVFISNTGGQMAVWMVNADGSGLSQLRPADDLMLRAFGILP